MGRRKPTQANAKKQQAAYNTAQSNYSQATAALTSAQNNVHNINDKISSAKKNNANYQKANDLAAKDLANQNSANALMSATQAKAQEANNVMQDLDQQITEKVQNNPQLAAAYEQAIEDMQYLNEYSSNAKAKAAIEAQIAEHKKDPTYNSIYDLVKNFTDQENKVTNTESDYDNASSSYDSVMQQEAAHNEANPQYQSAYGDLATLQAAKQALTTAQVNNDAASQQLSAAQKARDNAQESLDAATTAANQAWDNYSRLNQIASNKQAAAQKALTNLTTAQNATMAKIYQNRVTIAPITITIGQSIPVPTVTEAVAPVTNTSKGVQAATFVILASSADALPAGITAEWVNPAQLEADAQILGSHSENLRFTFPDGSTLVKTIPNVLVVNK